MSFFSNIAGQGKLIINDEIRIRKKQLIKDLNEIESAIEDKESFLKFIEKMKIAVEIEGKRELVTKDNKVRL